MSDLVSFPADDNGYTTRAVLSENDCYHFNFCYSCQCQLVKVYTRDVVAGFILDLAYMSFWVNV